MVGHEQMADFIDGAVVDRHEVPVGLGHQQVRGGIVRRAGLGQLLGEQPEPAIFGLVDCGSGRHQESDQVIGIDVMRADPQIVHHLGQFRRPIGAGERRCPFGRILIWLRVPHVAEHVRNDAPGMIFLAMRGEPAHDMTAQAAAAEDLPERTALACGGGDGNDGTRAGVHFREPRHAVVVRHLSRGDARPEHRGELRLKGRQVAARPPLDKAGDAGQLSGVEERMDDLPVGGIPANQQQPPATVVH